MSTLPIPHLQACAPLAHHLHGKDVFQLQEFCQTLQKTSNSSGVNLQEIASTSSTMSLLADIDFSKPVNSSTTFTQPATISVTQIPASQSYPSISTISTLQVDNAVSGTQAPVTFASNQSFDVTTDSDNQVLSKDAYQSTNNILRNSQLPNGIPDVLNSSNLFSEITACSGSTSINVDADKIARISESIGGAFFLWPS